MKDSQLLSAFQELTRPPLPAKRENLIFDACQLGVVLRAVLFVEAVMAVGALVFATGWDAWIQTFALLSAAALPGILGWLVVTCSAKRLTARLPAPLQRGAGIALGAVCGLYGCALVAAVANTGPAPWLASPAMAPVLATQWPAWRGARWTQGSEGWLLVQRRHFFLHQGQWLTSESLERLHDLPPRTSPPL